MNAHKKLIRFLQALVIIILVVAATAASAEDVLNYLTDNNNSYTGPTVEDNISLMDTDKNGFADVFEVRAFLELKHGKGYEKALLDRWEVRAQGGNCPVPFAKEFYSNTTN